MADINWIKSDGDPRLYDGADNTRGNLEPIRYGCPRCGAVVTLPQVHQEWHDSLEGI